MIENSVIRNQVFQQLRQNPYLKGSELIRILQAKNRHERRYIRWCRIEFWRSSRKPICHDIVMNQPVWIGTA
jgi:hypothetical protein